MNTSTTIRGAKIVVAVLLLALAGQASAIPLKLEMVTDELRNGKAVLQGSLGGFFNLTDNGVLEDITAKELDGTDPEHWSLDILIEQRIDALNQRTWDIAQIAGRHISNPPPDPGEASPGPPLVLMFDPFEDLDAIGGVAPAPLSKMKALSHDGHFDKMMVELIDLEPDGLSVLQFTEVRMNITFTHPKPATVAEPATIALLALGLLGVASRKRVMITTR